MTDTAPSNGLPAYVTKSISMPNVHGLKRETEVGDDAATGGVYILFHDDVPVYIGQSQDIQKRISQHRKEGKKEFDSVAWLEVEDLSERLRLEGVLCLLHLPIDNATLCLRLAKGKVYQLHYRGLQRPKRR